MTGAGTRRATAFGLALAAGAPIASAADSDAELAKKLQNPVAALVSVPMQYNWDTGIGEAKADRSLLNIQPVIPFSLNDEWVLISRTIVPLIDAQASGPGTEGHSGLGDITQSAFFSPKKPTASGWIWGAGPVLQLPTATDSALGSGKWSVGPTVVVLRQENGWTYGALANQLWSVAGSDSRSAVSALFLQPFVSFTTKTYTSFTLNTESTYDWKTNQWTVPINVGASQLLKLGGQPVSFALGYRDYVERPDGGPRWGLRFTATLLFPK
jgi:hypothetical protein